MSDTSILQTKLENLVDMLENLDYMIEKHQNLDEEKDALQIRCIEQGALKLADDFSDIVYSLTDEELEEIDAALEEYSIEEQGK